MNNETGSIQPEGTAGRNWKLPRPARETVQAIKAAFHYPDFISTALAVRGVDSAEKVMEFVRPHVLAMNSPFYFRDMVKAVERIEKAIAGNEPILIFGDKDVDGVTATAILFRFLQKQGANVVYRVPEGGEGYGITRDVVRWAVTSEIALIITVDCGITSIDEIEYANSVGLEVIVTDHHEPRDKLPPALAIINPKVREDGYPFMYLSGAAVALKLVFAMIEKNYISELYNQEIVFFDLETTGLNPARDDIVEIGAVKVKNGVVLGEYQKLIKIGYPMPKGASDVNKITDSMLERDGIPAVDALRGFVDFANNCRLVGHNAVEFDMRFLQQQLKKHLGITLSNPVEDTLKMARVMVRKVKDYTLTSVAQALGFYTDPASLHRSVMDSRVCAEVYRRLLLGRSTRVQDAVNEYLPLAALGTVADIMPLNGENRNLVKNGLRIIGQSALGLVSLLRAAGISPERVSARDISWGIAPLLNSPGRVGDASISVEILVSGKVKEVDDLVVEITNRDAERKNRVDEGLEIVLNALKTMDRTREKIFIIGSEKITRGTTGLIANRVAYQEGLPAMIIHFDGDTATGSIRSTTFDVVRMLESMKDVFIQFGGHKSAGGFTLKKENMQLLKKRAEEYLESGLYDGIIEDLCVDAVMDTLDELNLNNLRYMENIFEPTGNGNDTLRVLVPQVKIVSIRTMGKDNLHVLCQVNRQGRDVTLIGWNMAAALAGITAAHPIATSFYDIVATPEINRWQGTEEARLSLVEIRPAAAGQKRNP